MPYTNALDPTTPLGSDPVSAGDDQIRSVKAALIERINSWFGDVNADPWVPQAGRIFPSNIRIDGAAGTQRILWFTTAGAVRWSIYVDANAESGGDAGSPLILSAYSDAGTLIDNPLTLVRAAGGALALNRPAVLSSSLNVVGGTLLQNTLTVSYANPATVLNTTVASTQNAAYEITDAGALRGRFIYAGGNSAGQKYIGILNDSADYLNILSIGAADIRFGVSSGINGFFSGATGLFTVNNGLTVGVGGVFTSQNQGIFNAALVPIVLGSTATLGVQIQLGTGTASYVGTMQSSGDIFLAYNAGQAASGSDAWAAVNGGTPSQLLSLGVSGAGLSLFSAVAGKAPGTKAAFWGSPIVIITAAGAISSIGNMIAPAFVAGANPAATGIIRIPNSTSLISRNAANSADIALVGLDSANIIQFGNATANFPGVLLAQSGISITAGGLAVGAGGLVVTLGGADITGATTVHGNLTVTGTIGGSITAVGALAAGSIVSGFGNINNSPNTITTSRANLDDGNQLSIIGSTSATLANGATKVLATGLVATSRLQLFIQAGTSLAVVSVASATAVTGLQNGGFITLYNRNSGNAGTINIFVAGGSLTLENLTGSTITFTAFMFGAI